MKNIIMILVLILSFSSFGFAQWSAINAGFDAEITNIVKINDEILVSTKSKGVFYSNDETNWSERNSGLTNLKVYAMEADNGELIAGTYGGGVFFSSDKGNSWIGKSNGLTVPFVALPYIVSVEKSGSNVFAGNAAAGIFRSTDSGDNWSNAYPITYSVNDIYKNQNKMYAGVGPYILRSVDNGFTWTNVVTSNTSIKKIKTIPQQDQTDQIFVAGLDGFYYSLNNGGSWVQKDIGSVNDIAILGNNIFAVTEGFAVFESGIVYLSTDLGVTWTNINANLPTPTKIRTLLIYGDYIYAGSSSGIVYKRKLSDVITDVEQISSNQPSEFSLDQNYPNPFNPSTKIRFVIPNEVRNLKDFSSQTPRNDNILVTLKVYDVLGREVATLINEQKPAGSYEVKFDASDLSSGIYFYTLNAGSKNITKKMILLR